MAESSVLPVRLKNWMDIKELKYSDGVTVAEVEDVVDVKKMKIDVDVIMPDGTKTAPIAAKIQSFLREYKAQIDNPLQEALSRVVEHYRADQAGDKKAYSQAKSVLDKANKHIQELMDDFRVELRKAVAKAIGGNVKAKDLQTIGKTSLSEMSLVRGKFKYEVNFDDAELTDLSSALKKKKWQHCAVVWKGEVGLITIDPKRKIKEATIKKLKEEMPDGKGKGSNHAVGMIQASSSTKVAFEFLDSDGPSEKVLRNALKEQTGGMVTVSLNFPKQYSADSGGAEKEEQEDGAKKASPKKASPKKAPQEKAKGKKGKQEKGSPETAKK